MGEHLLILLGVAFLYTKTNIHFHRQSTYGGLFRHRDFGNAIESDILFVLGNNGTIRIKQDEDIEPI